MREDWGSSQLNVEISRGVSKPVVTSAHLMESSSGYWKLGG
jgi:hypothetical protein